MNMLVVWFSVGNVDSLKPWRFAEVGHLVHLSTKIKTSDNKPFEQLALLFSVNIEVVITDVAKILGVSCKFWGGELPKNMPG